MDKLTVGDLSVHYRLVGKGLTFVWTGGGFSAHSTVKSGDAFIEALAPHCQVFVWDRPNTGHSSHVLDDSESEWHLWSRTLRKVLDALNIRRVVIGGSSGGSVLSLLFAHENPDLVEGVFILRAPTQEIRLIGTVVDKRYAVPLAACRAAGIEGVIETPFYRQHATEPHQIAAVRAFDPSTFEKTLTRWEAWAKSSQFVFAHLPGSSLSAFSCPFVVAPGWDSKHPDESSKQIASRLPNANLISYHDELPPAEVPTEGTTVAGAVNALAPFVLALIGHVK